VLLVVNLFWITAFVFLSPYLTNSGEDFARTEVNIRMRWANIFQVASLLALPLVYLKAVELSHGQSVFSVYGYIALRTSLTENGIAYGWLSYFTPLSFVTSSVSIFLFKSGKIRCPRLILSLLISISYAYLSTGRTFFFLFLAMHVFPLILTRTVQYRGALIGAGLSFMAFVFVAAMTAKGVSFENGIADNMSSLSENIRSYSIAPLLAMSDLVEKAPEPALGANTFRSFLAVLHAFGFSSIKPPELIRDFVSVPYRTNVYTVYDVYFRDFGYFGFAVAIFFVAMHVYLYRQAITRGGVYIFLYSVSVYPLAMQFFQDQYFSLLSQWIQIVILYWVLVQSGDASPRENTAQPPDGVLNPTEAQRLDGARTGINAIIHGRV
jgi:oligosaccharide repeat unit polymerase